MIPNLERAVIEVVGSCNYSCQMCPQTTGRDKEFLTKMPLDLFEKILEQLPGNPVINLEGSGEPTLAKDLSRYVEACTKRDLKSYMYCNGSRLNGKFMRDVIDAGLSLVRFSCIGYNAEKYKEWMSEDNFELIKSNVKETISYIKETGSDCKVASYHLILDDNNIEEEIELYRENFIELVGTTGYIWKMHNWSGNYEPVYVRKNSDVRETCGRPFAPEITVRAGGIDGKHGAVTSCCQTLGPPNEKKSVLGHLEDSTLEEIWNGAKYDELRDAHTTRQFDKVDYCKSCDFLNGDKTVLAWSNDNGATDNHMLGTNFSLSEYKI